MTVLLSAKLNKPTPPSKRVRRPRIIEKLNEGLESGRQVTLVSAPAGFGKTTCISEWVDTLESWPISWLSLDTSDDDPVRFFTYFVAALQKVEAGLGQDIAGVLQTGELPPWEVFSTTLCNDMLGLESRFLFVLDDFHAIQDRFILQVLEYLIANLPHALYLVLMTREDPPLPLARLRANNQLTEVRAKDLRFSRRDTESFMREVMGLSLSHTDIAALEDKTEGWVAGLQLAALSIRDRANPSDFIAGLSGSHRFILSYLVEEVLSRQREEIQQFLLQTSILAELHWDLCNAVTGRADCRVLLDRLFAGNLFINPLDDEQAWYRYHPLFADLLQEMQANLPREKITGLHHRASRWYAQAGMPQEAIEHALAAEDYISAVELLETHATDMIMRGHARTVHRWVEAIPAELRSQSIRTNLAFAWMHLLRGAYDQANPYLERVEQALVSFQGDNPEDRSIRAEWLVMKSLLLNKDGKPEESLALAEQALGIVPEQDRRVQGLAFFAQAAVFRGTNAYERAEEEYRKAIQHGRAAGNFIAEMLSVSGLAEIAFGRGALHMAYEIAAPAMVQAERSPSLPPIYTVVFGILAEVCYHWHQTEEARRYNLRALHLSTLGGYPSGVIGCQVFLSRLFQLQGDLEGAANEIQKAIGALQVATPAYVQQETIAQHVRVSLARNRPAAAELAMQGRGFSFQDSFSYPDLPSMQKVSHSQGIFYNSSLCILLHHAREGRYQAGLRAGLALANQLISRALYSKSMIVALESLLLRAEIHAMVGEDAESMADTIRALELARPEGFISVFLERGAPAAEALSSLAKENQLRSTDPEFLKRVLAAFPRSQPLAATRDAQRGIEEQADARVAVLVEPLTDRELEVLRLMAEGLKYKEIGSRLFISLNTVRSHIKSIYGKLLVNNRTDAIEVAKRLNLL